ncbi:MAG: hypothetical protein ACODAD_13880, partial [Planctomycetota bacterium]
YSHNIKDTQSRSDIEFRVTLELNGLGLDAKRVRVTEYRFDRKHNSYYQTARELRPEQPERTDRFFRAHETYSEKVFERVAEKAAKHPTATAVHGPPAGQPLELEFDVAGNGLNFVIIEPAP